MSILKESVETRRSPLAVSWREAVEKCDPAGTLLPFLRRATLDPAEAHRERIEWFWDGGQAANYCEIKRRAWTVSSTMKTRPSDGEMLTELLLSVEATIELGIPRKITTLRLEQGEDGKWDLHEDVALFCGGFRHYLGRGLRASDLIRLRPLTALMLLENQQAPGFDGRTFEWRAEFSLEVVPG